MGNAADRLIASAAGLRATERGLWSIASAVPSAFSEDTHQACFQLESDSFWFQHRNRCIVALLRRHPPSGPVLDVGGGNGFVTQGLREAGFDAIVLEPGEAGARNAIRRGLAPVVNASLEAAQFPERSLSAVGMFDVLEHLTTPNDFLKHVRRLLRAEGRLYLTVPAYAWLWSSEDDQAGHQVRYTRTKLTRVLQQCGFAVDYAGYFFASLVAPIYFVRVLPERLRAARPAGAGGGDHHAGDSRAKRALQSTLDAEHWWIARGHELPFGASVLVAAHVKGER